MSFDLVNNINFYYLPTDIPAGESMAKSKNSFDKTYSSVTPSYKTPKSSENLVRKHGEKWINQDDSEEEKDSKEVHEFDSQQNQNTKMLAYNENELTDVKLVC